MSARQRLLFIATLLVVAVITIDIRWSRIGTDNAATAFAPWPDGLEYACGAQSIKDTGRYFLQVGPHEMQPRYPPAWSTILAIPLSLGASSQDLLKVSSLFDALHGVLLSVFVFMLAWNWSPATVSEARRFGTCFFAAVVAGLGFSVSPLSVAKSGLLMGDSASAFFCHLTLFSCTLLLLPRRGNLVDRRGWMFLGGCAAGAAMGMRIANPVLLFVPIAGILLHLSAIRDWAAVRRALLPAFFGWLLVSGCLCWIVWNSGRSPFDWSGYEYWCPELYSNFFEVFNFSYLFEGHPIYAKKTLAGLPVSNLEHGFGLMFGITRLDEHLIGRYWPAIAWGAGAAMCLWLWRRGPDHAPRWSRGVLALGLVAWPLAHVAFYGVYCFSEARLFMPMATLVWGCLAFAIAIYLQRDRLRRALPVVGLVTVVAFASSVQSTLTIDGASAAPPEFHETVVNFPDWLEKSDDERAGRPQDFNVLVAQALGYLPPRVVSNIEEWGLLSMRTEHVGRALECGRLEEEEIDQFVTTPIQAAIQKHIETLQGPFPVASADPVESRLTRDSRSLWSFESPATATELQVTREFRLRLPVKGEVGPIVVMAADGLELTRSRFSCEVVGVYSHRGAFAEFELLVESAAGDKTPLTMHVRFWGGSLSTMFYSEQRGELDWATIGYAADASPTKRGSNFATNIETQQSAQCRSSFLSVSSDRAMVARDARTGGLPTGLPDLSQKELDATPTLRAELVVDGSAVLDETRFTATLMLLGHTPSGRVVNLSSLAQFTSSDTKRVSVDGKGRVVAHGTEPGEVTIRATVAERADLTSQFTLQTRRKIAMSPIRLDWDAATARLRVVVTTANRRNGVLIMVHEESSDAPLRVAVTQSDPAGMTHYAWLGKLVGGVRYELQSACAGVRGQRRFGERVQFQRRR